MTLSGDLQITRQLIERCQALATDHSRSSLSECDRLIVDIDQVNDWGFITDRQAIEMLKIVYRVRHNLMRNEKVTGMSIHSMNFNSVQDR